MSNAKKAVRRPLSIAASLAIAGSCVTCITPEMVQAAQAKETTTKSSTKDHMEGMLIPDKDGKPNTSKKSTKIVQFDSKKKPVEDTRTYERLKAELLAGEEDGDVASPEGIDVSFKLIKDGSGHGTKSQTFINSNNGYTPGDNDEKDGYVTAGDTLLYDFQMNFSAGKKRHIDIIWSNVQDGSANNLCESSEAGITAVGRSDGYCRYIIEEGATGSISRQVAYKAPHEGSNGTEYKWAPKFATSLGEMNVDEVTVLSAPTFDVSISSSDAHFGERNTFTVRASSYKGGPDAAYSHSKGAYIGEVKPYRVAVDVSQFPEGTIFPNNEVVDGKIILTMNKTSESQDVSYLLPQKSEGLGSVNSWNVSIDILDELVTLDGKIKNVNGGKDPVERNNSTKISVFKSGAIAPGEILKKSIYSPRVDGVTIYDEKAKTWKKGSETRRKAVAAGTQLESRIEVFAKNNNRSPQMHLIDVWNPKSVSFDGSRDVVFDAVGIPEGKEVDYDIYYTTKDLFPGNAGHPEFPKWNDSSWTKDRPSDTSKISGVRITVKNNEEISDGTLTLNVPQIALQDQDYDFDPNTDGDSVPAPDWYQTTYTSANGDMISQRGAYDENVDVIGPVYPKALIKRSTGTKDNTKTLGETTSHTINPYIYDVMDGKVGELDPKIVEYLDRCLTDIQFSEETKRNYDINVIGTPGSTCGDQQGEAPRVELTPKSGKNYRVENINKNGPVGRLISSKERTPSVADNYVSLPAIDYTAKFSYDTPAYKSGGYSYSNRSDITVGKAKDANKTDTANVVTSILQKTDVSAVKTAERTRVGLDDDLKWRLRMNNFSGSIGRSEFIDVLPWNGSQAKTAEGEKTKFSGDLKFVDAKINNGPKDAKILYTNADPKTIDTSKSNQAGVTWFDTPEQAGGAEKVTAIKVVVPRFGGKNSTYLDVELSARVEGAENGDIFVNQMSQVDLENKLKVPAPGPVGVKSVASNLYGNIWWDKDHSYTNNSEEGIKGISVYAQRAGDTNILKTTTDAEGNYSFEGVRSGKYDVWIDRGDEKGKVPVTGTTTYKKTEQIQQTFSYGGNHDNLAEDKVSLTVLAAQDIRNIDFGFMLPDPIVKIDKRLESQQDNQDGTVTIKYNVSATNTGTGTINNLKMFDSAEKNQSITAEMTTIEGAGDYVQVEDYNDRTNQYYNAILAIDSKGNLFVSKGIFLYGYTMDKVELPDGVRAERLHEDLPIAQLSDGRILTLTFGGDMDINEEDPYFKMDKSEYSDGRHASVAILSSKDGKRISLRRIERLGATGSFAYNAPDGRVKIYYDPYGASLYVPKTDGDRYNYLLPEGYTIQKAESSYGFGNTENDNIFNTNTEFFPIPIIRDGDGNTVSNKVLVNHTKNESLPKDVLNMSYYYDSTRYDFKPSIISLTGSGDVYISSVGKKEKLYIPGGDAIIGMSMNHNNYSTEGSYSKNKLIGVLRGEKSLHAMVSVGGKVQVFPIKGSNSVENSMWVRVPRSEGTENDRSKYTERASAFVWVDKDGAVRMIDSGYINNAMKSEVPRGFEPKTILKKGEANPASTIFSDGFENDAVSFGMTIDDNGTLSRFDIKENSEKTKVFDNMRKIDGAKNIFQDTQTKRIVKVLPELEREYNVHHNQNMNNIMTIMSYYTIYTRGLASREIYAEKGENATEEDIMQAHRKIVESSIDDFTDAVISSFLIDREKHDQAVALFKKITLGNAGLLGEYVDYNSDTMAFRNLLNAGGAILPIDILAPNDTYEKMEEILENINDPSKTPNDVNFMIKNFITDSFALGSTKPVITKRAVEPSSIKSEGNRTLRTYDAGTLEPGQTAQLELTATVDKGKKDQFLSNMAWVRSDETPSDAKDPKNPKIPSNLKEYENNDWGLDTGNGLKANITFGDDDDLYDGVPVYVAGDETAEERVTIGGRAWKDINQDGIRNDNETDYISGVTVTITTTGDNPRKIGETVTGEDGTWSYEVPKGQNYTITFGSSNIDDPEKNYTPTKQDVGDNDDIDSDGPVFNTDVITGDVSNYDMGYTLSDKGFDVQKTRSGAVPQVKPGSSFTDTFTISVRNVTGKETTLGKIVDSPVIPEGMKVTKITWQQGDGKTTEAEKTEGGYLIGDSETKIGNGEVITFTVKMEVAVGKDYTPKKDAYGNKADTTSHKDIDKSNNGGSFDVIDNPGGGDNGGGNGTPGDGDNGGGNGNPGGGDNGGGNGTPGDGDNGGGNGNPGGGDNGGGNGNPGGGDNGGNKNPGSGNRGGGNSNGSGDNGVGNGSGSGSNTGKGGGSGNNTKNHSSKGGGAGNGNTNNGMGGGSGTGASNSGAATVGPNVNTGGQAESMSLIQKVLSIFR